MLLEHKIGEKVKLFLPVRLQSAQHTHLLTTIVNI